MLVKINDLKFFLKLIISVMPQNRQSSKLMIFKMKSVLLLGIPLTFRRHRILTIYFTNTTVLKLFAIIIYYESQSNMYFIAIIF